MVSSEGTVPFVNQFASLRKRAYEYFEKVIDPWNGEGFRGNQRYTLFVGWGDKCQWGPLTGIRGQHV